MCKHGLMYEQCSYCCPPARKENDFAKRAREQVKKAKKLAAMVTRRKKQAAYDTYIWSMIHKCECVMGDYLGEYAVSVCGEEGIEKLTSGAWSPTKAIILDCMHEAISCYFPNIDFKDRSAVIKKWKKYSWN